MSLTLVVRTPSFTLREMTGFLHVGLSLRFFFGGHLHLSSSSWGTGPNEVASENPTLGRLAGVKRGALAGLANAVRTVDGLGSAMRAGMIG